MNKPCRTRTRTVGPSSPSFTTEEENTRSRPSNKPSLVST